MNIISKTKPNWLRTISPNGCSTVFRPAIWFWRIKASKPNSRRRRTFGPALSGTYSRSHPGTAHAGDRIPPVLSERASAYQLRPYFVKLYERRWYVYGPTVDNPQIKVYALDRIQNLSISKQSFRLPKGFSAGIIWQPPSALLPIRYSAALHRNQMHRRAAAIPAGPAPAYIAGRNRAT